MTIGKHCIQGVTLPKVEPRSSQYFESLMVNAGYTISGSAPAQDNRLKNLVYSRKLSKGRGNLFRRSQGNYYFLGGHRC